ncbi:glycosyltransferase family 2 protein [Thalassococcus sp. CAU 1522]|uniref:Glycosyltransferase family 2 protein n=1 Tax=Thalassococcus arenae TaxID=2851652 RepID=A0ABS6NAQ2_9RHOB|nr:glycosyltransferase family 2 protein [Thalassococcus arenae]MBV2361102.1 glycosyltransferase family 2 protein [Thalassococcus arenae]
MQEFGLDDGEKTIRAVHGDPDPSKRTVFVPVKNEMGFLPAFLAHYRAIGFEQFLVYDDKSDDGTTEYLIAQPDCVVVHTNLDFGDELFADIAGKRKRMRFGTYAKIALPQHFFDDSFVAYFDADEFLLLPPGVSSIVPVIERLTRQGASSLLTSVVEFFPETLAGLEGPLPQSLEGLLAAYPYFQAEAVVDPDEDVALHGKRTFPNPSKTMRLFESFDVHPRIERRGFERIYMSRRKKESQMFQRSARHKTPLVLRNADSFATSCHDAHPAPPSDVLLTIAHFVFTSQFAQKIDNARKWRAHAGGAAKYRYYAELLDKMQAKGGSFLDARSQRYTGPEQLIQAGLMRW